MSESKEIKISSYHLVERMQEWIVHDSAGPLKGRELSSEGGNYIERQGLDIFVRVEGVEQIYSIKGNLSPVDASKYRGDFSVHTVVAKPLGFFSELQGLLRDCEFEERLRKKLEGRDKEEDDPFLLRRFYQIFSEPRLEAIEAGFKESSYAGLRASTAIREIPTGAGGSIANSFFDYAEDGIATPLREIAREIGWVC